jgi:hypothetical protein
MTIQARRRLLVAAALLAAVAVFALGFFVALGVRSVVAGPESAPAAAPPNPGHTYDQVELPVGTWTGLDADMLDGLHASEIMGRPGFATTTVDSGGDVGQWTSVTVGADGLGLISYSDGITYDLKVAHCSNAACSASTITTVDSGISQLASVTVGADGLGLISYFDGTNSDLKVAHCGNAACSAGNTITTVDSGGDVGGDTSVTVGADGLPLISYYDTTNRNLKVAHCGNAACTSSTTTTVDSGGDVGRHTSVTVGVDGLGLISYYDATNDDLKVAHCSNRFCVPYHRPR